MTGNVGYFPDECFAVNTACPYVKAEVVFIAKPNGI
jgi:hypothetical protein